jgi:putative acetyltransferase
MIRIREEQAADAAAIDPVIAAAFKKHPRSDQRESLIVRALRDAGALTIALVAEEDHTIVGHVAFSPVEIAGAQGWHALGPLAVAPVRQNAGIGSALVRAGLDELRAKRARGSVVVGEPGFYTRFGFAREPGLTCAGVPDEYVLALAFAENAACGRVVHHPAFEAGL